MKIIDIHIDITNEWKKVRLFNSLCNITIELFLFSTLNVFLTLQTFCMSVRRLRVVETSSNLTKTASKALRRNGADFWQGVPAPVRLRLNVKL